MYIFNNKNHCFHFFKATLQQITIMNKSALGFIFTAILIDVVGLGLIIPVLPSLIKEMTGGNDSEAALYGGWMMFTYAAFEFLFAPLMGALSDRFGRKKILVASLFGFTLDYLFLAIAPTIFLFFVGRVIAGILGASYTTGTAYIADISKPEERAKNFALVGVAFGLGFIIGPFLGGVLGSLGNRIPFYVAAAFSGLNCLFGLFFVPESLPLEKRRAFDWRRANPVGTIIHLKKYPELHWLMLAFFLFYLSGHSIQSTWTYFNIACFQWTEWEIGVSLAVIGVLVTVINGFMIDPVIKYFGIGKTILGSAFFLAFGLLCFSFATASWMMYLFMIPYLLGGICEPAIQSLISNKIPDNEQGEIQGALTGLISLSSIAGPVLMTNLFYLFTSKSASVYFPGAPFFLGFLITLLTIVLLIPVLRKWNFDEN